MVPIEPLAPTDEPDPSTLETTAPLASTDESGAYIVLLFVFCCILIAIDGHPFSIVDCQMLL
jgi:hypothetical protein